MKNKKILYPMLFIAVVCTLAITLTAASVKNKNITLKSDKNTESTDLLNTLWSDITPQMTDISFLIADLKYDGNSVKILELGEGPRSYFNGHEQLYGEGKIWQRLWLYLEQFKLPIWYIGEEPNTPKKKQQIAYEGLKKIGGSYIPNLTSLMEDPIFKKRKNTVVKNFHRIEDHAGIIIFRRHRLPKEIITKFKKEYPQFIILDNASTPHVNNKNLTSLLFNDRQLKEFRPTWQLYEKTYSPTLAKKIINDFEDNEIYVIKPINAANGWGVILTNKNDLDSTLKLILTETKKKLAALSDTSYNYWARDSNKSFLVESFVASKTIQVQEKAYDPTMRMIFILALNNGKINLSFLGGYWKLPQRSLVENGTLNQCHKSKIKVGETSSAKISQQDTQHVKEIMRVMLPRLYAKMLVTKNPYQFNGDDQENQDYQSSQVDFDNDLP